VQRQRPAYNEDTLARAVREGIDSAGRLLDPLMPRFQLGDRDMAALTAHLRKLGATPSPGVGPARLRLATLIAGDVDPEVERAVLDVMNAYIAARNRSGPQRLRGGRAPEQLKETYRKWSLDVWRISGPPESWRAQLEASYREHPVFALVGGIASASWQPVHDFCETAQLPCLLPDTDLPPAEDGGFYSFYFSRGLRLEAEIIAAALAAEGLAANVIAVVDGDTGSPSAEANATLAQALERRGGHLRTVDIRRESDAGATVAEIAGDQPGAVVLWLNSAGLRTLAARPDFGGSMPLFLSATLLGPDRGSLPADLQLRARLVLLTALPGEPDSSLQRFRAWARGQGVPIREERHQALAYFACMAFADATKHAGLYLSRDYLMDLLNHASTLTAYLPLYLRAGITPGQRVLSRGGYLVDLAGRREPVWLVP
jgi:ABC-type branched-subunit amino acid transport system substrate-binding protein